jgi:hypothetical protein
MAANATSIKDSITTNFATNNAGLIVATIMRATLILIVDWVSSVISAVPTTQNLAVVSLVTESLITHNLDTLKVSVQFYRNNRLVTNIDWEPVSTTQIRIYLPYSDTPVTDTFSGEIFLIKRV